MNGSLLNSPAKKGGIYFSCLIVAVIAAALAFSSIKPAGDINFAYLASPVAILLVSLAFLYLNEGEVKPTLGLALPKRRFWLYALLALAAMFFGLSGLNDYFIAFLKTFGYKPSVVELPPLTPLNALYVGFAVCLLPAVFEEIAFRGIMVNSLGGAGRLWVSLLLGALFSLYHLNPAQTLYQFAVGFIFTLLAVTSQSVLPGMVLHFINNSLIVVLYYAAGEYALPLPVNIVLTVFGVACTVALIVLLLKEKQEKTDNKGIGEFSLYAVFGIFVCLAVWVGALL